jgi:hypothetical protein
MNSWFFKTYTAPLSDSQLLVIYNKVDSLIANGQYHDDRPLYQTKGNILLAHPEFSELKKSFLSSVRLYLGDISKTFFSTPHSIVSWVYCNWNGGDFIDNGYHCHNPVNPTSISGIYYLSLPEKIIACSTRFAIGGKLYCLPPLEGTWFLFPSVFHHQPGRSKQTVRRYTLSADIFIHPSAVSKFLQSSKV